MSVNSSASSNHSHSSGYWLSCFFKHPSSVTFTVFTMTNMLLVLPPCFLVLHHGLQRRRKRSYSAAAATHSDSFTYNVLTTEVVNVVGTVFSCCGIYGHASRILEAGFYCAVFSWYVETFFHVLTSVEHYLAVVHPVTYLSLRRARWIRTRDIVTGCIWLVCLGFMTLMNTGANIYIDLCLLTFSFTVISFCSLSALCVLVRAGPQRRSRVDLSKQRALYTIGVILGLLLLRCVANSVWAVLFMLHTDVNECVWLMYQVWTSLPCSLVLPLLYLHRTGMLACCQSNNN